LSITDGLHVPVIPFVDVVGSDGTAVPEQIVSEVPKLNVGVMIGLTVTVNVAGNTQEPPVGVNVYVPEALLFTTDGLHVPVIPFVDVVGKVGTDPPAQIFNDVPKLNVGVTIEFTVTVNITGVAHCPASGVNV
jgi:hypothetical protein